MRELTQEELNAIKKIELDILLEVDCVCKQENIDYSLAFGTLLGAVRHKGFIPWDDDIDIMMRRKDYDRFLEVAPQQLKDSFYLVNYKENIDYAHAFSKVMAKNTTMKEVTTDNPNIPQGIWIDVFPIDITPDDEVLRKKQFEKTMQIRKALFCISNYTFGKKGIKLLLYRLKKVLYVFSTRDKLIEQFENLAKAYDAPKVSTEYVMNLCGNESYEKETFKRDWFENYVDIEFEKHRFKAIKDYDDFLHHMYGDYMMLPPVDKRVPHHYVNRIDYINYKSVY